MVPLLCVVFLMWGYIISYDSFAWTRLIAPLLGVSCPAAFLAWKPFDPYQIHYKWQTGVTREEVNGDPAARWLKDKLKSREARRLPWTRLPLAITISYGVVLTSWILAPPRSWRVNAGDIIVSAGLWLVPHLLFYIHAQLSWAFDAWPGSPSLGSSPGSTEL
jgi:hypothetical protein